MKLFEVFGYKVFKSHFIRSIMDRKDLRIYYHLDPEGNYHLEFDSENPQIEKGIGITRLSWFLPLQYLKNLDQKFDFKNENDNEHLLKIFSDDRNLSCINELRTNTFM
jgi:hypothetical protein